MCVMKVSLFSIQLSFISLILHSLQLLLLFIIIIIKLFLVFFLVDIWSQFSSSYTSR